MILYDLRGKEMYAGGQPVNEILLGTTSIMNFVKEPIFPINTLHESSPSGLIIDDAYLVKAQVQGYNGARYAYKTVPWAYAITIDGVKCFRTYEPSTVNDFDEASSIRFAKMFQNLTLSMAGHTSPGDYKLRYKGRTRTENNTINVSHSNTAGVNMLFTPEWETYESSTFNLSLSTKFNFVVRGDKTWHLTDALAPLFKDIELIKV